MNHRHWIVCSLGLLAGCGPGAIEAPPRPEPPVVSRPAERPAARPSADSKFTGMTRRDQAFAEFLREKSGGMIRQASVALETKQEVRVELDRSVSPDDTLPLTNSLLTGARRDFPDQPITMAVYDPTGDLIMRARYRVGQGVKYQLAGEENGRTASVTGQGNARSASGGSPDPATPDPAPRSENSTRSGATPADREFADWAEEHGKAYLRYVEADLSRHGRFWFGVTSEVKPADVPNLTKSLLEGAHKKFPDGDLMATVFDPDGNKIGRATLGRNGSIQWEH